jgi:hypothetical protein
VVRGAGATPSESGRCTIDVDGLERKYILEVPSTVSSHLQAAMRRLGARDRAALADLFFTPPAVDADQEP